MPAHSADLVFVPWLRNPFLKWQLHLWECSHRTLFTCNDFQYLPRRKAITKCCCKAHQLSYKNSQSSAVSGSALAQTRTIWQIQLFTAHSLALLMPTVKTPAPSLKHHFFNGKCWIFFPFFSCPPFFLLIVIDHGEQIIQSGKLISICCPVGKPLAVHSWKLSVLMDVSLPKSERLNKTSVCNFWVTQHTEGFFC